MSSLLFSTKKMLKKNPVFSKIARSLITFFRRRSERKVYAYIRKNYTQLLEKYNNVTDFPAKPESKLCEESAYPVWVFWFQGEENMPEIIKMCYSSLLKNADGHKVNLITANNCSEFIDIPEYISEYHRKGVITHTHFSDILRMSLLSKYGGLWLDASIYISKKLPPFDGIQFWTGKWTNGCEYSKKTRWTGFLLYCLQNSPFAGFVKEGLYKYWNENNKLATYLIIDVFITLAYEKINVVKNLMDNVPATQRGVFDLYSMLNSEYDKEEYESLCKEICFHKLTYKEDFMEYTKEGKLTFYGHLMQEWMTGRSK
ncbi:MAG: capsular polysaccharide synthesis protein [Spirochaetaceae bacterium]|nr:capsular polysaccharide synthesis protein [Spirochaetaceae bacterium]